MEYRDITDLALASFLLIQGYKMFETVMGEKRKIIFRFLNETPGASGLGIDEVILSFYNNEARVSPMMFAETLRNLKAMIHQGVKK